MVSQKKYSCIGPVEHMAENSQNESFEPKNGPNLNILCSTEAMKE